MRKLISTEVARLANTLIWSWQGWTAASASEKTRRQLTRVNRASAALRFAVPMTAGEAALILALGPLVLAAELLNTGLEAVVDCLTIAPDRRAKQARDCGSAAVALTAQAGGVVWLGVLIGQAGGLERPTIFLRKIRHFDGRRRLTFPGKINCGGGKA